MEESLLKAALTLVDLGFASFDECVEALKKCGNDVDAACEMLFAKLQI